MSIQEKHSKTVYSGKFKARELNMMHSLGKFTVELSYSKPNKIVVNAYQYSIICLFNDRESITYSEI